MMPTKYKAWSYQSKEFFKVAGITFNEAGMISSIVENGNFGAFHHKTLDDAGNLLVDEGAKLVKFIGLYSKSGKEIYDGDIVKVCDLYNDHCTLHIIKWFVKTGYPAFDLDPQLEDDCNSLAAVFQSGNYDIEVVGSIFKNPELLCFVSRQLKNYEQATETL